MALLSASIDWFSGHRSGHMGADQYVAHKGMRDGKLTSGALLWAEAEVARHAASGNMVNAETGLLHNVTTEIGAYLPYGITVVELGVGTTTAFKSKTLPILRKLKSKTCVLVDESTEFLKKISMANEVYEGLDIKPILDDFFENQTAYWDGQALVCSFGSTISNIVNPVSPDLPQEALVNSLSKIAHAANQGWILIGFDSDQNGERIKDYFKKHSLFQLNIFDRMAVELPIKGDFDPKAFSYEPEWIKTSAQLAHIAIVDRDMDFQLGGKSISLRKGQRLHIKNSYKFSPEFFEMCCRKAGLSIIKAWSDNSPAKIYLLKIQPREVPEVIVKQARAKEEAIAA